MYRVVRAQSIGKAPRSLANEIVPSYHLHSNSDVSRADMALFGQTADYDKTVAKAKTDLAAGLNDIALAESNDAIQIDASRWEAYLITGGALQNKRPFDSRAVAYYKKALERAAEPKKAGIRDLLEQCNKLSAPSPTSSAMTETSQTQNQTTPVAQPAQATGGQIRRIKHGPVDTGQYQAGWNPAFFCAGW